MAKGSSFLPCDLGNVKVGSQSLCSCHGGHGPFSQAAKHGVQETEPSNMEGRLCGQAVGDKHEADVTRQEARRGTVAVSSFGAIEAQ